MTLLVLPDPALHDLFAPNDKIPQDKLTLKTLRQQKVEYLYPY